MVYFDNSFSCVSKYIGCPLGNEVEDTILRIIIMWEIISFAKLLVLCNIIDENNLTAYFNRFFLFPCEYINMKLKLFEVGMISVPLSFFLSHFLSPSFPPSLQGP